jgi:hypothetical protein
MFAKWHRIVCGLHGSFLGRRSKTGDVLPGEHAANAMNAFTNVGRARSLVDTVGVGRGRRYRWLLSSIAVIALAGAAAAQNQTVKAPVSGGALDIGADLAGTPDARAIEWPGEQYQEFLDAESHGRYFLNYIRNHFRYERLAKLRAA